MTYGLKRGSVCWGGPRVPNRDNKQNTNYSWVCLLSGGGAEEILKTGGVYRRGSSRTCICYMGVWEQLG